MWESKKSVSTLVMVKFQVLFQTYWLFCPNTFFKECIINKVECPNKNI